MWELFCASTATVINTTPCSVLIAMVLHVALEETIIQKIMILIQRIAKGTLISRTLN